MFSFKVAYPFRSRKIIRFYLLNDKTRIVKERKKERKKEKNKLIARSLKKVSKISVSKARIR